MFTSRNLVTILLILGVGALGWVGGARFAGSGTTGGYHAQDIERPAAPSAAAHAGKAGDHDGHGHAEKKAEDSGHGEDDGHGHHQTAASSEICPEHRVPENRDVLCNPGLMTALLPGEGVKMRLAAPEAAARAGIVIAPAKRTGMAGGPAIPALATYNRGRLAEVMALAGGTVRRIAAEPGQTVAKGALLAEIASPGAALARADYQAAQGRLQLAEANVRREQELFARGICARVELEKAQAEQQAARAAVEQLREQLAAYGADASGGGAMLALRSPLSGTIVARNAVAGQTLTPETPLFTVADLSNMWLEMQVSTDQATQAEVGAAIEAEFDGLPGQRFPGRIVQVGAGLDERTRLLKVVAEIANPNGRLKDGMFGQARLATAEAGEPAAAGHQDDKAGREGRGDAHGHAEHSHDAEQGTAEAVAVPAAAVQAIDGKSYVFVALEQDLFELRRVEAGPRRAGEVIIVAGLGDGEMVAASQGFALKSELLKSRLGASCADH